ncbi:MAG: RNA polymerase Rpb4 family protein [Desulfurococcales archaeon]|nr:RNA polymerase Rpb4 family protein [Desulfurococcales archaeon]
MRILSFREAPLPSVKKILLETEARGVKLQDLQRRVLEHATIFSKCREDKTEELVEKLMGLGLREVTAVHVVNICPRTKDELLSLLNFEQRMPDEEHMEKILEMLGEHCRC